MLEYLKRVSCIDPFLLIKSIQCSSSLNINDDTLSKYKIKARTKTNSFFLEELDLTHQGS